MRLTIAMRERIVDGVMADIPTVDYVQQMRARGIEIGIQHMPPQVRRIWDTKGLRHYVRTASYTVPNQFNVSFIVPGFQNGDDECSRAVGNDEEMNRIIGEHKAQREHRTKLRKTVEVSLVNITIDHDFRARFPDLSRYLPAEAGGTKNLPTTTMLMDALVASGLKLESEAA